MWGDVLDPGSEDSVTCQTKTAMLITIRATVTTGNRSVGMLSLTGIRAGEAYGLMEALKSAGWARRLGRISEPTPAKGEPRQQGLKEGQVLREGEEVAWPRERIRQGDQAVAVRLAAAA